MKVCNPITENTGWERKEERNQLLFQHANTVIVLF